MAIQKKKISHEKSIIEERSETPIDYLASQRSKTSMQSSRPVSKMN